MMDHRPYPDARADAIQSVRNRYDALNDAQHALDAAIRVALKCGCYNYELIPYSGVSKTTFTKRYGHARH